MNQSLIGQNSFFGRAAALFGLLLASACASIAPKGPEKWAVYYSDKADSADFKPYNVVVLDGDVHPQLETLKAEGKTLLGYISVGEVHNHKAKDFADELIVEANEQWDSSRVDVRQPDWHQYIIHQRVPQIMNEGFDGVMLDTLDAPLYLESKDTERFTGSRDALIYLIRAIHYHHPHALIMVNRGFDILPDIKDSIDMILAESILSNYDLKEKRATYYPDATYLGYVDKIKRVQMLAPHIKVYSLDYWDINDSMGVERIYNIQRKQGFIPYVTTPDLNTLTPEPTTTFFRFATQERT